MMLSAPYPVPPIALWRPVLAVHYLLIAVGGVAIILHPPMSYRDMPMWLTLMWGCAAMIGGTAAATGVMAGKYKLEWPAAWLALMGVGVYAMLSWRAVHMESTGHLLRACYMTSLALAPLSRAILLGRIDRDARRRREAITEAEDAIKEAREGLEE